MTAAFEIAWESIVKAYDYDSAGGRGETDYGPDGRPLKRVAPSDENVQGATMGDFESQMERQGEEDRFAGKSREELLAMVARMMAEKREMEA